MNALPRRVAFSLLPAFGAASAPPASAIVKTCPAAAIGRELVTLLDDMDRADRAWLSAAPDRKGEVELRFESADARWRECEDALTRVRATSLPGALAQAMVASSIAFGGNLSAAAAAKFDALMVSVVGVLEAAGGVRREDLAGDVYMRRALDGVRASDGGFRADAEIVDACAKACALIAAFRAKPEPPDDWQTVQQEAEFYAELNEAEAVERRIRSAPAFAVRGLEAKARLAAAFRSIGDREGADALARSVCDDLARGVFTSRSDGE